MGEQIKPNAIECYDCGRIYRGEAECPEEPQQHGFAPVYVSSEPLGRPDDGDCWHFGLKLYVYDEEVTRG